MAYGKGINELAMWINKNVQCVSCNDIKLVRNGVILQEGMQSKTEVLMKVEHKNSVPSIIIHQYWHVLLLITIGYLLLTSRDVVW